MVTSTLLSPLSTYCGARHHQHEQGTSASLLSVTFVNLIVVLVIPNINKVP
jgi:hypothetical protein